MEPTRNSYVNDYNKLRMKKIPNLFKRDWNGDPSLVLPEYEDGTEWVQNGEGVAFRKWDGTSCMIKDGNLYKRYDAKRGKPAPPGGIPCQEPDPITGHWPHWIIVDFYLPENRWLAEAWDSLERKLDGTYEAVGPKIGGNKEGFRNHFLMMHRMVSHEVPITYAGLKLFLEYGRPVEGYVFHHQSGDGRMCKVKRTDFGLKW